MPPKVTSKKLNDGGYLVKLSTDIQVSPKCAPPARQGFAIDVKPAQQRKKYPTAYP